ncbi:MAG: xylose isomerase [Acidobacteria bacterium]|nr:MAG: xylose isomerase [Acidobacteriota bacterium]
MGALGRDRERDRAGCLSHGAQSGAARRHGARTRAADADADGPFRQGRGARRGRRLPGVGRRQLRHRPCADHRRRIPRQRSQRVITRREFIVGIAGASAALRIAPAVPDVRVGYAAITWRGRDLEAIADIADAGYPGIQLRATIVPEFISRPAALRDELAKRRLTFVALSSGNLRIDPAVEADELGLHTRNARFLRDAGGLYLQVIDERPKGRPIIPDDYTRLGHLMAELGKRTADIGIPLAYHHHMNSLGEKPDEIARIMDAADPRYVKLLLDIAHYQQGGGDPIRAVRQYADRLIVVHVKDVESPIGSGRSSYRFVELGRGRVDVKGAFAALADVKFHGWVIVELDAVSDDARTPKEAAILNKQYLEHEIGLRVG